MRFLLATDFGHAARSAYLQAVSLSSAVSGEVILLHAVSSLGGASDLENADLRTLDLRAKGEALGGTFSSTVVIRMARPEDLILDTARELGVDVVFLGTGSVPDRLGSTVRALLRESATPLWLVQEQAPPGVSSALFVDVQQPCPRFLDHLIKAGPGVTLDVLSSARCADPVRVGARARELGCDLLVLEPRSLPALARSEWVSEVLQEAPSKTSILSL